MCTLFTVQAVQADSPTPRAESAAVDENAALAGGARFHAITPYRAIDSRNPGCKTGGFLAMGEGNLLDLATDSKCDLVIKSEDVVAVSYNLTVDQTVGFGFLALYPSGGTWGGTSAVNWTSSGLTVGNGGIVETGRAFEAAGFAFIEAGGGAGSGTHYIVDITGYFAEI